MSRTIHVTLAEVPTDVLCHLAMRTGEALTPAEITKAVAPADAGHAYTSVLDALYLLRDGLYVSEDMNRWQATAEGRAAVVEGMTRFSSNSAGAE